MLVSSLPMPAAPAGRAPSLRFTAMLLSLGLLPLLVHAPASSSAAPSPAPRTPDVQELASLPDPDGEPADMGKKVQVFILMGQSNMLGAGKVGPAEKEGSLTHAVQTEGLYPFLVDDDGAWTERKDVRNVRVMASNGKTRTFHNEWMTVKGGRLGPEYGIGHHLGNAIDAPVMVLKSCIGNRSLGWDLLPPGSERFVREGQVYAGYKDSPDRWEEGTEPVPINWYAGKQYDDDTANAKKVLAELEKHMPGYEGQGYEIAGFVWWQGHKDQNPALASRYEQNLVHLIKTLRKDFDAPEARFVLATIGFGGEALAGPGLQVAEAQLAVDGRTGKYPEFADNVRCIDARPWWRGKDVSPNGRGYHYNHNAETYMEVGRELGEAMVSILPAKSGPR